MIVAVNVMPESDAGWIMVINLDKLDLKDEDQKCWHKAITKVMAGASEYRYPNDWGSLEKARVKKFPVKIDGIADVFFGCTNYDDDEEEEDDEDDV